MGPVNWHDHEMQSMSVRPMRRSMGGVDRILPGGSPPLAGLLLLVSATASFGVAQTGTARRTVWTVCAMEKLNCRPWYGVLRPKLRGL